MLDAQRAHNHFTALYGKKYLRYDILGYFVCFNRVIYREVRVIENYTSLTDEEFKELYERNIDTVYRIAYIILRKPSDAEDAAQDIFLKFLNSNKRFNDSEHEKAWFIVITRNHCRDILRNWWKFRRTDIEALPDIAHWDSKEESGELLEKLLLLPEKYKTVLYLYYFEEYSVKEISGMLKRKESTIQTQLSRGRNRLKINLVKEEIK